MKGYQLLMCAVLVLAGFAATAQAQQPAIHSVALPGEKPAAVQVSPACPRGICPGLGLVFYLPNVNSLAINTGGRAVFSNLNLGDCVELNEVKSVTREFVSADSMENLVKQTMAEADISGSYSTAVLSMKGTAQARAGYASDITETFHSTHMDIAVVTHSADFRDDSRCFSAANLDPAFLRAFGSLPLIEASKVAESISWEPYVNFLTRQGSHIMMQQQIGSRFQQWESSNSKDANISQTLQIKACAEAEGKSAGGGWTVNACGAYDDAEERKAKQTQTQSRRVILGGTDLTRNALGKDVNKENLDAFIDASNEGNQAIRFIYKPIWELLRGIYEPACAEAKKGSAACDNLQRAVTLQAAYEGWTAIGCPETRDNRNAAYQAMAIAGENTLGLKTYQCTVAKTGCRTDDDCHLGGGFATQCYCYGAGCIDQGDAVRGTGEFRDKVRGNKAGGTNDGVNKSCNYKFGAHCDCDRGWAGGPPSRTLYRQGSM